MVLAAAVMLAAVNLRPALTSVAALLSLIGERLALGPTALGVLTTLPVLCLGLAAPLAPLLTRRIGMERAVLWLLAVLALALLARPYLGAAGFFIATALVGAAMGTTGVLLPALVKRDFPTQVGLMTGLYTVVLSLGAALGAGATEPLRIALDGAWQFALAAWMLPVLPALAVWLPLARGTGAAPAPATRRASLLGDALAWQVTLFMGLQSSLAYSVFGWLPAILADRGLSAVTAGVALSAAIVISMASALAAPWVGGRMRDQRLVNALSIVLFIAGAIGCVAGPLALLWPSIVLLGTGMGAAFAMALTLIALRAPDTERAGQLSAMAQGFGYILAAGGPLAVGLLHDATGGWNATVGLLLAIGAAALASGIAAGRDRLVGQARVTD
ncbi:MAG: MFS transporter [Comamonadaceae bacterium]|nr:MFS transporter [Burkholderiales bacterium]MEB2349478.1 MFS transporter [Comamonadaceae bacterium]